MTESEIRDTSHRARLAIHELTRIAYLTGAAPRSKDGVDLRPALVGELRSLESAMDELADSIYAPNEIEE